ncbi:glycosyltransferase family 39 protein [Pyrococcus kukulkanii]|uniref:glycosyltransferase family 39 protein n=1 Tax=Pyrococcus kukulkanii TaxID=1609559 RepID=UPI000A81AA2F|nr:glycosyltransferase family 39 protein [Pyrococcus kukulkanii]
MNSQLFPNPKALIPIFLPLLYLEVLRYQKTGKRKYLLYAGLLLGLMLWSHYGGAMPVFIGLFFYALLKSRENRENKSWLLLPLVGGLIFSPFVVNVFLHIEHGASLMVEGNWLSSLSPYATIRRVLPPVWGIALLILALWKGRKCEPRDFTFFMLGIVGVVNVLPSILFIFTGIEIFPSRFVIPLHYTYLLAYFCGIVGHS